MTRQKSVVYSCTSTARAIGQVINFRTVCGSIVINYYAARSRFVHWALVEQLLEARR